MQIYKTEKQLEKYGYWLYYFALSSVYQKGVMVSTYPMLMVDHPSLPVSALDRVPL